MGLREDLERFRDIGEQQREDLTEFIKHGNLGPSGANRVKVPIKIIELPEFEYDQLDQGGVGQSDSEPEEGQPVDVQSDDGDEEGEPGEDGGEHGYYEMDPEEFAQELDEELGLDLEPKGKKVIEEVEGDFTDISRQGPNSTLELDELFKRGLKRKLSISFDEEYARAVLRVDGVGPRTAFEWLREQNVPVSYDWLDTEYTTIDDRTRWSSLEEMDENVEQRSVGTRIRRDGIDQVPFRRDDERYRYPEVVEEKQKNVVVINIRDVSGSMRQKKRELVERTFTPMDWYLQGKYDNAEFVYIAHDAEAWEVDRDGFFGIHSGGGTRISSAYQLAQERLEQEYPWSEWNRYVFAAGDGENAGEDSKDFVVPLMREIDANRHAYVEVQPGKGGASYANHGDVVDRLLEDDDDVVVERVSGEDDVLDAVYNILDSSGGNE